MVDWIHYKKREKERQKRREEIVLHLFILHYNRIIKIIVGVKRSFIKDKQNATHFFFVLEEGDSICLQKYIRSCLKRKRH